MKLIYIANARMPTEKAHGIQIMKMCEAFSRQGIEVELVIPWRFNKIKENPFEYYGVERNFKITKIPSIDLVKLGKIGFFIQSCTFAKFVSCYLIFSATGGSVFGRKKADIIYSRDALPLFFLSFFRKNIFWETHTAKDNFIAERIVKKCDKIIAITQGLRDFYVSKGIKPDKILVAPDAVDIEKFKVQSPKLKVREELNLPMDKILVGYVGTLKTMGMEKGIDTAIEALKFLDKNVIAVLVGGHNEDIEYYKKLSKESGVGDRVVFVGRVKYDLVPMYLKACDILIAPFPEIKHYKFYMSPLKIFEYMASGRPIVASDLPSLREVLNENNSILVPSENSGALAEGIKKVLQNQDLAKRISEQAYRDVQEHTWQKRAQRILDFVNFSE